MFYSTLIWRWLKGKTLIKLIEQGCLSLPIRLNLHDWFILKIGLISIQLIQRSLFILLKSSENLWIELYWISLIKVSYAITKLGDRSHLLKLCLNNTNQPIIIDNNYHTKKDQGFKTMFEQNWSNVTTLCMTGNLFV